MKKLTVHFVILQIDGTRSIENAIALVIKISLKNVSKFNKISFY